MKKIENFLLSKISLVILRDDYYRLSAANAKCTYLKKLKFLAEQIIQ